MSLAQDDTVVPKKDQKSKATSQKPKRDAKTKAGKTSKESSTAKTKGVTPYGEAKKKFSAQLLH